ncbi:hypothetical protein BSL78_10587 [Apostichopus japonicus]|uniref:Uncharacterized protein n=1 Tax=Stichopus japonicus TaxID=307972 RepID=A0A2G8KWW7_STIJA|nr:hypothetical protein BSL78_10587 [Apostichopus japonicus]
MAQEQTTDVLKTLKEGALQCSLCLELLKDPKVLDCLHRFCRQCLDELCLKGKAQVGVIVCPCCRQNTNVPAGGAKMLKSDFLLHDILEKIQGRAKEVTGQCGSCSNTGELPKFCKTCQCVICLACVTQHEKMKVLQSHVVVSLDSQDVSESPPQGETAKVRLGSQKCSVHREETLYYSCTSCAGKIICNTCFNTAHRQHHIKSFEDVVSELKQGMKTETSSLSEMTSSDREALHLIEKKRQEVNQEISKGKILIDNVSKELIESIKQEGMQLHSQLEDKGRVLSSALNLMEEKMKKDMARSVDILTKTESYLSQAAADVSSITSGREYLGELQKVSSATQGNTLDTDWIKRQFLRFCPSGTTPSIGSVSCNHKWVLETSWDVGLIHEAKDAITGMVTLPSGKLLLSISRETQATYVIISNKDGSLGWRKNFSIQNFPPFTPCYAISLGKNTIVMAWRHVITRYDMSTNKGDSYGMKIPHGTIINSIAADEAEERIIISHSGKNEIRLYDNEINDARETIVGESHQRITKIVSHSSTETYLLCDDQGTAFAVDKYDGKTTTVFQPPSGPKTTTLSAKAVCGSREKSVFVLCCLDAVACVAQYIQYGIPVARFETSCDAALMSVTTRNGKECLVICSSRGLFHVYSISED